jgi:hypothetical protein
LKLSRTFTLFLLFQALYALTSSGNLFRVPDEFEVYFQIEHLVDAGDLSVPQTLAIREPTIVDGKVVGSHAMFFGEMGKDGRPYAPYGPLAAVLAAPHHLLGRVIAAMAGVPRAPLPDGIVWLVVVGGITMLATATAAALAVAGFHRGAVALGTPPRAALTLALMLGGATVLWTYGVSFFSEAWQAAAFVWAAALLLEARSGLRGEKTFNAGPRVAAAAVLLVVAGLTKFTSLVFAPAFVIAILADRTLASRARFRAALVMAIAIAAAALVHLGWNIHRFGQPFDFGYDWAETVPRMPARAFLLSDIPRGLGVLLLSPGKSIFLWAPAIVLAIWHTPRFAARERAVFAGVATASLVGLLFFAAYQFPEGGYAHGPRNLVPIVPLVMLLACGADAGRWPRPLVASLATVGFLVALMSTSVSFLQDQTLGRDLAGGARTVYYERVDPPQGRPWNRYRFTYVPFVQTLMSAAWLSDSTFGLGPDYFPNHLRQARTQLPRGLTIPSSLVWGWPIGCTLLLALAAAALLRSSSRSR